MKRTSRRIVLGALFIAGCATQPQSQERGEHALSEDGPAADELGEETYGVGEHGPMPPERGDAVRVEDDPVRREPPIDLDADGVPGEHDCDDLDGTVSPLATEVRCNGADENCK